MSTATYCRLAGQVVTLGIHSVNCIAMFINMQNEELLKDPQLQTMTSMQSRYLTVWNIAFQLMYFSLAFMCDMLTVTGRDHMITKRIRRIRHSFFAGILWPITSLIFFFFWPFFILNRELLFPAFIDKMFSFKSNLAMHFCILPAALWELVFLPRTIPKSHRTHIGMTSTMFVAYNALIIHTHSERGVWPYPFFYDIYGTILFPIFMAGMFVLGLVLYYLQWRITAAVWGDEKISSAKKIK